MKVEQVSVAGTTKLDPLSKERQAAQATPDAFGYGVGTAMKGAGAEIAGLGETLDKLDTQNAEREYNTLAAEQSFKREELSAKFQELQGENAIKAEPAHRAALNKLDQEYIGRATNSKAQKALRVAQDAAGLSEVRAINNHVTRQREVAADAAYGSIQAADASWIASHPNDPAVFAKAQSMMDRAAQRASDRGVLDPKAQRQFGVAAVTPGHVNAIHALLAVDDTNGARVYFEKAKKLGQIDGAAQDDLEKLLRTGEFDTIVFQHRDRIRASVGSDNAAAYDLAEKITDGKQRKAVEDRLDTDVIRTARAKNAEQDKLIDEATVKTQRGEKLAPAELEKLGPRGLEAIAGVRRNKDNIGNVHPYQSDYETYNTLDDLLSNNPAVFAETSIAEYASRLDEADYKKFRKAKEEIIHPKNAEALRGVIYKNRDAVLKQMLLDTKTNAKLQPALAYDMRKAMDDEIESRKVAKKPPPTQSELAKLAAPIAANHASRSWVSKHFDKKYVAPKVDRTAHIAAPENDPQFTAQAVGGTIAETVAAIKTLKAFRAEVLRANPRANAPALSYDNIERQVIQARAKK